MKRKNSLLNKVTFKPEQRVRVYVGVVCMWGGGLIALVVHSRTIVQIETAE